MNLPDGEEIMGTARETVKEAFYHVALFPHHATEPAEMFVETAIITAAYGLFSLTRPENVPVELDFFCTVRRKLQQIRQAVLFVVSDGAMRLETESVEIAAVDVVKDVMATYPKRKPKRHRSHAKGV